MKRQIVVLSGAGMSEESGISTFRGNNGLWDSYDVMQVAHIDSWPINQDLILQFYNHRRKQLASASPNIGHQIIVELENYFNVVVVTQNIDDLHERAGSKNVIHLHGELRKACSSNCGDKKYVIDIGYNDILPGDLSADGSQLRPFIVWFGEDVPEMNNASTIVSKSDIIIIIGTSMRVYPAASLIYYARTDAIIYLIDPAETHISATNNIEIIKKKASDGMRVLKKKLIKKFFSKKN